MNVCSQEVSTRVAVRKLVVLELIPLMTTHIKRRGGTARVFWQILKE